MSDQIAKGGMSEVDSRNVALESSADDEQYHPWQTQYPPFYQWEPSGLQYPPYPPFPFPQELYPQAPMKGSFQETNIKEESEQTRVKEEINQVPDPYQQTHLKSESSEIPNMPNYFQQFPHFYPPAPVNTSETMLTNNDSDTNSFTDNKNSYNSDISSRNSSSGYDSAGDIGRSPTNQMEGSFNNQNANVNNVLEKGEWMEDISSVPPGWKIQKMFSPGDHVKTMVMSPEGNLFSSRKEAFIYMETHLKQPRKFNEFNKRKDDNNSQPLEKKIKTNLPKETFEKQSLTGSDPEIKARGQTGAIIWDYFTKMEGTTDARCLNCNVSVIRPLGTTSNMMGHLKTYHKDLYPVYEIHQKEAMARKQSLPKPKADKDNNALPFKIPSSIEICLVKENSKDETNTVEQTVIKKDPIDIMEKNPLGPKISIKLTSFESICSIFLKNPTPSPSVIFGISDNNKISMEDVKLVFTKLRSIFQYVNGQNVAEVALRRLVGHVMSTHRHKNFFEF